MNTITISQRFRAPRQTIFDALCDHENFGRLTGATITRIRDGQPPYPNGLGSVRRIKVFPAPAFEETVVTWEPGHLMEYEVTLGSPIKNHRGRMVFREEAGETVLDYTITFEPRLPLPLLGTLLEQVIGWPIARGLRRYAASLAS